MDNTSMALASKPQVTVTTLYQKKGDLKYE